MVMSVAALRASKLVKTYLDHALTGVAIECRRFGPLTFVNRRQQSATIYEFRNQRYLIRTYFSL